MHLYTDMHLNKQIRNILINELYWIFDISFKKLKWNTNEGQSGVQIRNIGVVGNSAKAGGEQK